MFYGNDFSEMSKQQKEYAISDVLRLATHNGISKDTIIEMLRYVYESKDAENAELKARLEKAKELPLRVMINQQLNKGKFSPKGQEKNGLYGVVYEHKGWLCPVVDICGFTAYDDREAQARIKELEEKK